MKEPKMVCESARRAIWWPEMFSFLFLCSFCWGGGKIRVGQNLLRGQVQEVLGPPKGTLVLVPQLVPTVSKLCPTISKLRPHGSQLSPMAPNCVPVVPQGALVPNWVPGLQIGSHGIQIESPWSPTSRARIYRAHGGRSHIFVAKTRNLEPPRGFPPL